MKSKLFKCILLGVVVLSTSAQSSDTTPLQIEKSVSMLLGAKKVSSNQRYQSRRDAPEVTTRADVELRLGEKLNSHASVPKNSKLKGDPIPYLLYDMKLSEEMARTILTSLVKKYPSDESFYLDKSLDRLFMKSTIKTEWNAYLHETNAFKKRRALKALDEAFDKLKASGTTPHSANYIVSYPIDGTYDFDFDNMSKTFTVSDAGRWGGLTHSYFEVLDSHRLQRAKGDRGDNGRENFIEELNYLVGRHYDTTTLGLQSNFPVKAVLEGSILDISTPNQKRGFGKYTIRFEDEGKAETFENFIMDPDDKGYLQIQMRLDFNDKMSMFMFTPVAVEIKSANKNMTMSDTYFITKTGDLLGHRKFVNKTIDEVLHLKNLASMRKHGSGKLQLFNGGNELYYLFDSYESYTKINNGREDIQTKGALAKYSFVGVLEGDIALWTLDSRSKHNIGKALSLYHAYDYIALKKSGDKIKFHSLRSLSLKVVDDKWLEEKFDSTLGDSYRGDLSSGEATPLTGVSTKKTKPQVKSKVDKAVVKPTVPTVTKTNINDSASSAAVSVTEAKSAEPPVVNLLNKDGNLSITCDLSMKDTGGFFNGQHIVGTQKTDVPHDYLINRIPQIMKNEGFGESTGDDKDTLYYLAPQDSGGSYSYDVKVSEGFLSIEFKTYAGVSVGTKAMKSYMCGLIEAF